MLCTSLNFINDPVTEEDIAKWTENYLKRHPLLRRKYAVSAPKHTRLDEKVEIFDFTPLHTFDYYVGEMSMGRQEAFEIFRRDYPQNPNIEENKRMLKQKYAEAKSLGETVNHARTKINKLKSSIEQHRMSRVMQGLVDPDNPEPDDLEQEMRHQIEEEKNRYKESFNRLRTLKTEIEHLQHLLEKSKVQLMKDFELWWAEQAASLQEQQEVLREPKAKAAWRTPPLTPNHGKQVFSANSSQSSLGSESYGAAAGGDLRRQGFGGVSSAETSGYRSQDSARSHRSGHQKSSRTEKSGSIPLTGDAQADADIMAFLKARQNVIKQAQQSQGPR